MALAQMRRVEVIAPRREEEKILTLLQELGVMEISDLSATLAQATAPREGVENERTKESEGTLAGVAREQVSPAARERTELLSKLQFILDFLGRYQEEKRTFIEQFTGKKFGVSWAEFTAVAARKEAATELYQTCKGLEEELARLQNELANREAQRGQLAPWVKLDLPLEELGDSAYLHGVAGELAVREEVWAEFTAKLAALGHPLYLERVEGPEPGKGPYRFVLFVGRAGTQAVEELLSAYGVSRVEFPPGCGTAAARLAEVEAQLATLEEKRAAAVARVVALAERRPEIQLLFDYVTQEVEREETRRLLLATQSVFALAGWVVAADVPRLREELQRQAPQAYLAVREPLPEEEPPVALANRRLFWPFESVLELYSAPQPREIDPTPWVAPFFTLFFGIMLTDAGYGIFLAILSLLLLKKIRMEDPGKKLFLILFWGGISSVIMGALAGGWFGDLFHLPPLWFNPLDEPIKMLVLSFALGLVHIYVGLGLEFYENVRNGAFWTAVFDQGFWLMLLTGLVLLLAAGSLGGAAARATGQLLAGVGAVGLVLTQGRHQKNIFLKLGSGLVSLYNVTGFLGDVLSYSRLLALGLATGVIANVINIVARMAMGLPYGIGYLLMVLVLVGGHTFNIFINTMGAYVHTSRLQYVEFFGKFFEGGGKVFVPFKIRTRFTYFRPEQPEGNFEIL